MKQRDAMLVLGAVLLAIGISAILLAGSLASTTPTPGARPRIFFDPRNSPPPARTIVDLQRDLPAPLQPIVPLQRGVADTAREAAGYLLVLLGTAAAFVLGHDQVLGAYRASLGDWRAQLRVLATGLAVIGVAASAAALSWIVYLGSLAAVRGGPFAFGIPGSLQLGIAAFSVALVITGVAATVGFAAASWRLGDTLFRTPALRRFAPSVPAPLIALLGASLIYVAWQIPYAGAVAVILALAYALGAVVSARLARAAASAQTTGT